jgi:peptidoglycan/LPS O-acetylase OafA/YrhL
MGTLALVLDIISVIGFCILGLSLHELTHYGAGLIWTRSHRIGLYRGILPAYVDYRDADLPNRAIRVCGIAPFALWIVPAVFLYTTYPIEIGNLPFNMLAGTAVLIFASPSDLLAFLFPTVWRDKYMAVPDEELNLSHLEDAREIVEQIRLRL